MGGLKEAPTSKSEEIPATLQGEWKFVRHLKVSGQSHPVVLRQNGTGVEAVLKRPEGKWGQEGLERSRREIRILKSISHPNIVKLVASGEEKDAPWFLSPLGEPLKEHWGRIHKAAKPADLYVQACELVRGLVSGLAVFHDKGGVHRDIKPENVVMLSNEGRMVPVLIDFGIAYLADKPRLTRPDVHKAPGTDFFRSADAWYGAEKEPPPWVDCYGMMCLWAWLLALHPSRARGHYHPKYHQFVNHGDCENVRLLWVAMSSEEVAPKTAGALLKLMDTLGFTPGEKGSPKGRKSEFSSAKKASQQAQLGSLAADAKRQELAQAWNGFLMPIYRRILEPIREAAESARDAGLPLKIDHISVRDEQIIATAMRGKGADALVHIDCGASEGSRFHILLHSAFWKTTVQDVIPFAIKISVHHDEGGFAKESFFYCYGRDGTVYLLPDGLPSKPGPVMSKTVIEDTVVGWIKNEDYWRETGRKPT